MPEGAVRRFDYKVGLGDSRHFLDRHKPMSVSPGSFYFILFLSTPSNASGAVGDVIIDQNNYQS